METITYSELIALVRASKGAQPVGVEAITDAKAKKTGNPYGSIRKHTRAVGFIGANYAKSIEREQIRQGVDAAKNAFVAEPRPWGDWLITNKIATHKGAYYLRTQSTPGQRKRQRAKVLAYLSESGKKLNKADIAPFLPAPSVSKKQAEAGLVAIGEQIDVREYRFDSIQRLRIGGKTYKLAPEPFDDLVSDVAKLRALAKRFPKFFEEHEGNGIGSQFP